MFPFVKRFDYVIHTQLSLSIYLFPSLSSSFSLTLSSQVNIPTAFFSRYITHYDSHCEWNCYNSQPTSFLFQPTCQPFFFTRLRFSTIAHWYLLLLLLLLRFQWFEIIYLECSRNAVLKATFGIGYNYASERDLPTVAKVYLKSREKNYASLWCTRRPLIIHLFTVFSIKLLFHLTCIFHFFRNFDGEFSNVLLCDDFAFQPDHSKALEGFELH